MIPPPQLFTIVRAPSAYSWSQLFGFGFTPPAHPFTPSKDIFASGATPASLRSHLKSVRETPASPRSSIRYFSHEYPFEATIPATWVPWAIRPPRAPSGTEQAVWSVNRITRSFSAALPKGPWKKSFAPAFAFPSSRPVSWIPTISYTSSAVPRIPSGPLLTPVRVVGSPLVSRYHARLKP